MAYDKVIPVEIERPGSTEVGTMQIGVNAVRVEPGVVYVYYPRETSPAPGKECSPCDEEEDEDNTGGLD